MLLVLVGFCCPIFNGISSINGFNIIKNYDGLVLVGALLILIGSACGVILCFVDAKALQLLKLVALIVCIGGGVILFLNFNQSGLYKLLGKGILKTATYGFYMILTGWVLSFLGYFFGRR